VQFERRGHGTVFGKKKNNNGGGDSTNGLPGKSKEANAQCKRGKRRRLPLLAKEETVVLTTKKLQLSTLIIAKMRSGFSLGSGIAIQNFLRNQGEKGRLWWGAVSILVFGAVGVRVICHFELLRSQSSFSPIWSQTGGGRKNTFWVKIWTDECPSKDTDIALFRTKKGKSAFLEGWNHEFETAPKGGGS